MGRVPFVGLVFIRIGFGTRDCMALTAFIKVSFWMYRHYIIEGSVSMIVLF